MTERLTDSERYPLRQDGYPARRRTVFEHVEIAERILGRPLPPGAQVHHVNGVKDDNRNRNLVICEDYGYHALLHQRARALAACGHPDWRSCRHCGRYSAPNDPDLYASPKGDTIEHRSCARKKDAARRARARMTA